MEKELKVGDFVVNEYGNTGYITEINWPDEALVSVIDYGIKNDIDYCSLKLCKLVEK